MSLLSTAKASGRGTVWFMAQEALTLEISRTMKLFSLKREFGERACPHMEFLQRRDYVRHAKKGKVQRKAITSKQKDMTKRFLETSSN